MKKQKEKTMIEVYKDTRKDLMLFKLQTNAKNIPDVMEKIVSKLKEEVNKNENKKTKRNN